MAVFYRIAADAIVVIHFGYVAFVVVGFLLILLGIARRWPWVRNFWFRTLHLLAILIVAAEAICGITCPLTTWESELRQLAGQATDSGSFIARWVHAVLFFDFAPWVFTVAYALFAALVLVTFYFAPPAMKRPSRPGPGRPATARTRST